MGASSAASRRRGTFLQFSNIYQIMFNFHFKYCFIIFKVAIRDELSHLLQPQPQPPQSEAFSRSAENKNKLRQGERYYLPDDNGDPDEFGGDFENFDFDKTEQNREVSIFWIFGFRQKRNLGFVKRH